jgi:hypothetical protein
MKSSHSLLLRLDYAVVDEPANGSVARFGKYIALFIGTGE